MDRLLTQTKQTKQPLAQDLGACIPRFEISQKPYARRTLHHEALIGTALRTMHGRKGNSEAKSAEEFLDEEDTELSVQAAMMGDAGDENAQLIRFFDKECHDLAKTHQIITDHFVRLRALFSHGLCLQTGLTKVMLDTLRERPKTFVIRGRAKTIGGDVPDAVIHRCLSRMAAWCRLSEEICTTEFAGFGLLQAMSAFNLETHMNELVLGEHLKVPLKRLCMCLNLNETLVWEEFCSYLPIAVEEFKKNHDTFLAWAAALQRPPRGHVLHGASLRKIVKRLGGWGASTTGCERLLSKFVRTVNKHRAKDASEERIQDEAP